MSRWGQWLPLAVLGLIVVLSAFVLLRGGERQTVSEGRIGRPQPAYELQRLGGGAPVTSADFAGRAHVINLFASWCTPCRAEHPVLSQLAESGVTIVGVAYKDEADDAQGFLTDLGNPFAATALDPEGRFGLELGMAGVPETFVIGPDGAIRAVHRGPLTQDDVERVILPALARP
ncbi:cytochrome c-type biogenesis protein CcmG/DsbE [alpha proteobacterium U9-1i]|nr:cytochrome c-type biogenesis protein CcmG/DsbE [alpha proteobacterium U9-1i]